jgi:hypothetical protein
VSISVDDSDIQVVEALGLESRDLGLVEAQNAY